MSAPEARCRSYLRLISGSVGIVSPRERAGSEREREEEEEEEKNKTGAGRGG